jgi:hypothetical protein
VCVNTCKECRRKELLKVQIVEKAQGARMKILEKIVKFEVFIILEATRRVLKEHTKSVLDLMRKRTK